MSLGGMQKSFAQNANALVQDWIGTRKQVSLWLDVSIHRELETLGIIDMMKSTRTFRRSVITGLRVVWAYSKRDKDAILQELPDLREILGLGQGGDDDLKKELAEVKRLILEQQAHGIPPSQTGYTMTSTPPTTGKLLTNAKPLALPSFDDDDDLPTLALAKNTSVDAGLNFLQQLSGIH